MAVTATIPNRSIPIASLNISGDRYDLQMNEEWARFLRDLQVRSGGVTGVIPATGGGTGYSSYTVGDMLYADTTTSLARLNAAASGNVLLSGTSPSWGKVGLTTHVSGVLDEANGGTGFTAFGAGAADWLQTPTSANLAAALTDETGTGSVVFADTPTLIAPILGTPTSGDLANCTGYPTSALTGTVTVPQGGTGITSGASGGIPYFSGVATIASSALLTANALVLGGGAGAAPATLGSLGTTTTVLHGNAAGAPSFGAVVLTADVSGILPGANGGTGNGFFAVSGPAGALKTFTFPNASATVLTTDAAVTVAQGGTGITSGTSGGVPYFSGAGTIASSGALTASHLVLGGGAGAAPTVLGSLGTTTTVLHGNAAGAPTFGAVALTTDVTGTLPEGNGGTGFTAFGAGVSAWLQTPSSANLRTALTDETGTGSLVFANTPTLVTPVIGAATGTSVSLSSTATASAFIPSGSSAPTNGMYLPAANSVSISTNSTERIRIDSSGNVLPFTVGVFGSSGNPWGDIYSNGTVRGNALQTASSGSGSGLWKLGLAVAGVGLTLHTTSYVEIDIGGTTHKLAKVN